MATIVATEPKPWALKALPPFPQVAVQLMQVLSQEDAVMKQIVELLRMDQAFGAEVLRLANSAAYGFRSQIDSLSHAIVLLGTERVKALTMTVAMGKYAQKAFKHAALKRCWYHSLATAFLTEEIAIACDINRDRSYTAGLMRDVGRLALLAGYPVEYSNLIEVASENSMDMIDVERAMFDTDHREAGKWLAEEWKFPKELCEVIAERDHVRIPEPLRLATLVQLASHLSDVIGFEACRPYAPWTAEEILGYLPEMARSSFPNLDELARKIQTKLGTFGA